PFHLLSSLSTGEFKVEGNGAKFAFEKGSLPTDPYTAYIDAGQVTWLGKNNKFYIATQQHLGFRLPTHPAPNIESEFQWKSNISFLLNYRGENFTIGTGVIGEPSGEWKQTAINPQFLEHISVFPVTIKLEEIGIPLKFESKHFAADLELKLGENSPFGITNLGNVSTTGFRGEAYGLIGKNFVLQASYDKSSATIDEPASTGYDFGVIYANRKIDLSAGFRYGHKTLKDGTKQNNDFYTFSVTKGIGNVDLSSTVQYQNLEGLSNWNYSLSCGLHFSEERKDGKEIKFGKNGLQNIYSTNMPVMNGAQTTITNMIFPFSSTNISIAFTTDNTNNDHRNDKRYVENTERRLANNVTGEIISLNYLQPLDKKSKFSLGVNGRWQNFASQTPDEEHRVVVQPYFIFPTIPGIHGLVGFTYDPTFNLYGPSFGLSNKRFNAGASFMWDANGRLVKGNFGGNVYTSPDRDVNFSIYTGFDSRDNAMGHLIRHNQGTLQLGMDARLYRNLIFSADFLYASSLNKHIDDDKTMRDRLGGNIGLTYFVSPYFYVSGSLGLGEAKDESKYVDSLGITRTDVFMTHTPIKFTIGYTDWSAGLKAFMKGLKNDGNSFPYFKNQKTIAPSNDVAAHTREIFGGNFFTQGYRQMKRNWNGYENYPHYYAFYVAQRDADNLVERTSKGSVLLNLGEGQLGKDVALGCGFVYSNLSILDRNFSTFSLYPKALVRYGNTDMTIGPKITWDNGSISNWGLFFGVSTKAAQLMIEGELGNHGDPQSVSIAGNVFFSKNGVVSGYGKFAKPHTQIGEVTVEYQFLNTKPVKLKGFVMAGVEHQENPLEMYYKIAPVIWTNYPQLMAEFVKYKYGFGVSAEIYDAVGIGASYYNVLVTSPLKPFLQELNLHMSLSFDKLFRSGLIGKKHRGKSGGESGTDRQGSLNSLPSQDEMKSKMELYRHGIAVKAQEFASQKENILKGAREKALNDMKSAKMVA
ncbi:MAG: hypothetical protein NTV88_02790, partial [Candidatus Micrarchaeota archaeon]|nr:hypothetical protein [Candidatus Micrarchaeota archaeon]